MGSETSAAPAVIQRRRVSGSSGSVPSEAAWSAAGGAISASGPVGPTAPRIAALGSSFSLRHTGAVTRCGQSLQCRERGQAGVIRAGGIEGNGSEPVEDGVAASRVEGSPAGRRPRGMASAASSPVSAASAGSMALGSPVASRAPSRRHADGR